MGSIESKNPYRWRVLGGGFFCYMFDSFDLALLGMSLAFIIKDLKISSTQGGLLGTFTLIGVGLSAIIVGYCADNYGRRKTLFWSLVTFGVLTAAIYWAPGFLSILLLRFFAGLGLGGLWAILSAYLNETWEPKYRGRATAFTLSSFPIGAGVASFLAGVILPAYGWRALFLTGALSVLPALYMYFFVPESEQWKQEKLQRAKAKEDKPRISEIFAPEYRKNTILATLTSCSGFCVVWGVSTWLPTFLTTVKGLPVAQMAFFMVMFNLGNFVGMILFGILSDKIGKRNVLLIMFIGLTVSLPLYLMQSNPVALFWLGPCFSVFLSFAGIWGSYYTEFYPTHIRATGAGFCFNIGRGLSSLAPFLLGIIASQHGLYAALMVLPFLAAVAFILQLFLPGSRKKSVATAIQNPPADHLS